MTESDRVEWVRMQADCLLHRLFKNLFVIVEEDLKQANCYSPLKDHYEFLLDPIQLNGTSQFTVTRQSKPDAPPAIKATPDNTYTTFTFKPAHDAIEIRRRDATVSEETLLTVKANWNHESDTCGITINGKSNAKGEFYKPWQISREALSPLIFP